MSNIMNSYMDDHDGKLQHRSHITMSTTPSQHYHVNVNGNRRAYLHL